MLTEKELDLILASLEEAENNISVAKELVEREIKIYEGEE